MEEGREQASPQPWHQIHQSYTKKSKIFLQLETEDEKCDHVDDEVEDTCV